jgi:hypothetical protein
MSVSIDIEQKYPMPKHAITARASLSGVLEPEPLPGGKARI